MVIGLVPFEVATNMMDYNALPAGCCIIYCRPLLLELTSSEPLILDEEVGGAHSGGVASRREEVHPRHTCA